MASACVGVLLLGAYPASGTTARVIVPVLTPKPAVITPKLTPPKAPSGTATPPALRAHGATTTADASDTPGPAGGTTTTPDATGAAAAEAVRVTATPAATGSIAPGATIRYGFDVSNETSAAGRIDLAVADGEGFDVRIETAEGDAVTSTVLAAGEATRAILTVAVPASAAVGTRDVTTLSAYLDADASLTAQASVTTTVRDALVISPGTAAHVRPGRALTYSHTVTNSRPETRTVALSADDEHGWPATFYDTDGVTEITSVTVGSCGGTAETLVRLEVPADASTPSTDTLTVRAEAGTETAVATDTALVRRLETYGDAAHTTPQDAFHLTDVVYADAGGLEPGTSVYFMWLDPSGAVVRTGPVSIVDTAGFASDEYVSASADPVGHWRLELHADGGGLDLLEAATFTLTYKGEITTVSATDGRNVDSTVSVSSAVRNESGREVTGTVESYLMWWDGNGDGVWNAGDTYIDATGDPQPYTAAAATHETTIASVSATGTWTEPEPWFVRNTRFPNQGTYNVTATWRTADGDVIDRKMAQFYSVPTLGWPAFALLVGTVGLVLWRRRTAPAAAVRECT